MTDAVSWHSSIAGAFEAKYSSSPAFRERLTVWSGLIARFGPPGGHVLDAGCGSGAMTAIAARQAADVLAFDGSPEMVALARQSAARLGLGNVEHRVARFGDPSLTNGRGFDLILCSSVLEYLDDWHASFDWLAAALAPGGTILFSMPNGDSLYRKLERQAFRVSGRPSYYAHVRNVPKPRAVTTVLGARSFGISATEFYAGAPLVSPILRPLGLARYADTLFVVACGRAAG